MKKHQIFTLAIIFITMTAFSQTDQGSFFIGGSSNLGLNFNTSKTTFNGNDSGADQKSTSFNISPRIGYFVIDNLVAGISLPFNTSTNESGDEKSTFSSLSVAPFVRYYFTDATIKPFIEGQVGFGTRKNDFNNGDSTSNLFSYGALGGVAIFINETVSFDLGLNYRNSTFKSDDENFEIKTTNSQFGFKAGISIIL